MDITSVNGVCLFYVPCFAISCRCICSEMGFASLFCYCLHSMRNIGFSISKCSLPSRFLRQKRISYLNTDNNLRIVLCQVRYRYCTNLPLLYCKCTLCLFVPYCLGKTKQLCFYFVVHTMQSLIFTEAILPGFGQCAYCDS